jgi:hypothetical protein
MFQTTKQDKWKNSTKNSHPLRPIIISSSSTTTATMAAACGIWVIHIPKQELSVLGTAHHLAKTPGYCRSFGLGTPGKHGIRIGIVLF